MRVVVGGEELNANHMVTQIVECIEGGYAKDKRLLTLLEKYHKSRTNRLSYLILFYVILSFFSYLILYYFILYYFIFFLCFMAYVVLSSVLILLFIYF